MKKLTILSIFVLVLFGVAVINSPAVQARANAPIHSRVTSYKFVISGKVVDATTKAGIPDAQVNLKEAPGFATTNDDGDYTLTIFAPKGKGHLVATATGYKSGKRTVGLGNNSYIYNQNFALKAKAKK